MIVDVFLYNGEAELLELRYNILKDKVDRFIACEAPKTFTGKPKDLFGIPEHLKGKIEYHIIDTDYTQEELDFATKSPNTGGQQPWIEEFLQREALKKPLHSLEDDDIVYVSDCDEIWNPELNLKPQGIYKLAQLNYLYYLNNRISERWAGTFVGRWQDIKNECFNHLRATPQHPLTKPEWLGKRLISHGGWHFSNCMSYEEIVRKLESFSHTELNTDYAKESLRVHRQTGKDFLTRGLVTWMSEDGWPKHLQENRDKYKHLLLPDEIQN